VLRDFWITGDEQEIETVRGPPRPQSATTVTPLDSKRHPLTGQRANVRGQSDARLTRYQTQNVFVIFKPEFIALPNDFIPAADERQLFLVFQGSGDAVDVTLVLYVLDGLRYLLTEAQNLLLKLDQRTRRQLIGWSLLVSDRQSVAQQFLYVAPPGTEMGSSTDHQQWPLPLIEDIGRNSFCFDRCRVTTPQFIDAFRTVVGQ